MDAERYIHSAEGQQALKECLIECWQLWDELHPDVGQLPPRRDTN